MTACIRLIALLAGLALVAAACGDDASSDSSEGSGDISPYAGSCTIMNESFGTEVTVSLDGARRLFEANGLPNHETGEFPNAGNPNSISAQDYEISLPAEPSRAAAATPYNIPQPSPRGRTTTTAPRRPS